MNRKKKLLAVAVAATVALSVGGYALAGQAQPVTNMQAAWVAVTITTYPNLKPWNQPQPQVTYRGDVGSVTLLANGKTLIKFGHFVDASACATSASLATDLSSNAPRPAQLGFVTVSHMSQPLALGPRSFSLLVQTFDIHGKPKPLSFQLVSLCSP